MPQPKIIHYGWDTDSSAAKDHAIACHKTWLPGNHEWSPRKDLTTCGNCKHTVVYRNSS